MRDKKGQVNTLAPAIMALVFAAVVLVFGLVMTQELRDVDSVNDVLVTTANETLTTMTDEGETVVTAIGCGFRGFTVTEILNESGDAIVPTSNYTAYASNGSVYYTGGAQNVTFHGYNGTDWDVSYTYLWGDTVCEAANATVVGLATFADFWEIIVLAIVITIVIGLLLLIFGGAGRRR